MTEIARQIANMEAEKTPILTMILEANMTFLINLIKEYVCPLKSAHIPTCFLRLFMGAKYIPIFLGYCVTVINNTYKLLLYN